MSVTYRVSPAGGIVCLASDGDAPSNKLYSYDVATSEPLAFLAYAEGATLATVFEAMAALAADPRLADGFGLLVDLRAMKVTITGAEARAIAERAAQVTFPSLTTALVVSRAVDYGMSNMVSILLGLRGRTAQPFYDPEEALAWLRTHAAHGAAGPGHASSPPG